MCTLMCMPVTCIILYIQLWEPKKLPQVHSEWHCICESLPDPSVRDHHCVSSARLPSALEPYTWATWPSYCFETVMKWPGSSEWRSGLYHKTRVRSYVLCDGTIEPEMNNNNSDSFWKCGYPKPHLQTQSHTTVYVPSGELIQIWVLPEIWYLSNIFSDANRPCETIFVPLEIREVTENFSL